MAGRHTTSERYSCADFLTNIHPHPHITAAAVPNKRASLRTSSKDAAAPSNKAAGGVKYTEAALKDEIKVTTRLPIHI